MNQILIKMDERRVSDFQTIPLQIINYWQRKESLPVSLNDLADPISGFIVPKDSQTGQVYEYNVLGGLKFELCAVFSTTSLDEGVQRQAQQPKAVPIAIDGRSSYISDVWWHDVGRVCFERTIDPDLYPPLNNKDIKPQPL